MLKGRPALSTHCSLRILLSQKRGLLDRARAVSRVVLAEVGAEEHSSSASTKAGGCIVVLSPAGALSMLVLLIESVR